MSFIDELVTKRQEKANKIRALRKDLWNIWKDKVAARNGFIRASVTTKQYPRTTHDALQAHALYLARSEPTLRGLPCGTDDYVWALFEGRQQAAREIWQRLGRPLP